MADGIIGAISLGFQVTKELALYYSAFKSYDSDIQAVTKQIELVGNVFERLQGTIQRLTVIPIQSSGELEALLVACADCLRQLEEYAHKCKKEKYTFESLKDRADMIIKRFAYPFRKKTLEGLQRTLEALRGILQLMMHITHVDASKYWNEQVLIRHEYIQQALSAISAGQSANAVILYGLQMQLGSHTNVLLEKHVETQHEIRILSSQLDAVTSRLENLRRAPNQPVQTDIPPATSTTARWASKVPPMRRVSDVNSLSQFTCSCSKKRSRGFGNNVGPTRFFRTSVSPHSPNCPLFLPSSIVTSRGVRFQLNFFKAAYLIEMGIEYGVSRMTPNIRYHNVVDSWCSPAFQLVIELETYLLLDKRRRDRYVLDSRMLDAAFVLVLRSLSQIYRQGRAGIHDTNNVGETISHVLLGVFSRDPIGLRYMSKATPNHKSDYWVVVNEMIRRLTDIGLDFNHTDYSGFTPLDDLLTFSWHQDVRYLLEAGIPALIELEHSWENEDKKLFLATRSRLQNYGTLTMYDSSGFVGHDTILSIVQRSEIDLRKHLMNRHRFDECERDSDLVSAAIKWPEGLRILFAHGVSPYCSLQLDTNVLDGALKEVDSCVLRVLLELDTLPISSFTWALANKYYKNWNEDTDLPKEILFRIADQLSDLAYNQTTATRQNVHELYSIHNLTGTGAQVLYDRGLQDVDSHNEEGLTPFYRFAQHYAYYEKPSQFSLSQLQWLYNHGALVNACHPVEHTRASHFLAKTTLRYIAADAGFDKTVFAAVQSIPTLLDGHTSMLSDAFSDSTKDKCVCYCSSGGCDVATSALNSLEPYWESEPRLAMEDRIGIFTATSVHLGIDIDEDLEQVSSILRLMTFEILGMTHTCHSHYLTSDSPGEDISAYLHIETKDAHLLDDLMGRFEIEWSEYDGPFLDFIEHHWDPRMEEVLAERNAIPANEEKLQELGVSLYVSDEDAEEESEDDTEDPWTRFQRRVKLIVENEDPDKWERGLW